MNEQINKIISKYTINGNHNYDALILFITYSNQMWGNSTIEGIHSLMIL